MLCTTYSLPHHIVKTLNIRLRRQRLPKRDKKLNRLARTLADQLSRGDKYYHLLEKKHQVFFRTWVKKFRFPIPVALYVYKREGAPCNPRNALAYITTMNDCAWIGLSTETLKTDDWQNSIIHEMLHLSFLLNIGEDRILQHDSEEAMVIMLAGWISRSKEGKIYSNKVFGTNN